MIIVRYDKGSLILKGEVGTPYGLWDPRIQAYRAMALHYPEILKYLERSKFNYLDEAYDDISIPYLKSGIELRSYQKDALNAWVDSEYRGSIVLPTGAGKTYVALKAIENLAVSTLVVVPTIDLLDQWKHLLCNQFCVEIGAYGGGETLLRPLTVSTYDSAYLRAEQLGNKFLFVVFDEVHHLPAPSYSQIAEMYIAPFRMGLTATYEREDDGHLDLPRLVGGQVFQLDVDDLAGKHLSPYIHEKIFVELTGNEKRIYKKEYEVFTDYLRKKRILMRSPEDFRRFIMMTGSDPAARKALISRNKALRVALSSEAKIKILKEFLELYDEERTLIFTRYNQLVYRISRQLLIPAVTHQTPRDERREILSKFKTGEYRVIVTSQVLDEGVDVPEASLGFILSGTGSSREYIQRLGRILRKKEGKQAKLIEIVAKETIETRISQRRHL